MAPSLIETSYTGSDFPIFKKIGKSPAIETNIRELKELQLERKREQTAVREGHVIQTQPILKSNVREKPQFRTNTKRLWHDIHYTARWGAIPETAGMQRLALSDADKLARDWFVGEAKNLGCEVKIDAVGNIFAVLPGEDMDFAPIGIGSHLDTQPAGGRFDGILGVLAGLEVLRTIKESGIRTYAPIAAIVWTNEEGARFNPGCTGSAVWSGHHSISTAHNVTDEFGTTVQAELLRINYLGPHHADYRLNPLSAHLELHIEQGSRLQNSNRKAGIVNSIQGIRWYKVGVTGVRAHAGSTPMDKRADALVATASIVTLLHDEARKRAAFATVGMLHLERPSSNTIPGSAAFTIDIRCPTEEGLNGIEASVQERMAVLQAANPKLSFQMSRVWESPAVIFDGMLLSCIRAAAVEEVGQESCLEMKSFAGHDSALTASCGVPTAMIFVPSRDGISHAPEEYTSEEECGHGTQILLDAVLRYDSTLREHARLQKVHADLNRQLLRRWAS